MRKRAEDSVLKSLRKFWLKKSSQTRWILAVSGGVDSMVLLEGVARLCRDTSDRQSILVVHVNHGLRGDEADGDEFLVLARGRELGFDVLSFRLSWLDGENRSQDSCRRKRDAIFDSLCERPGDQVLLAHHLNDQAETVLFRLIRGTGARGLRGMLPVAGKKIRPFLGLEKNTLVAAAEAWGLRWREDSSNLDPFAYERNWLRSLFPLIEARRPGFPRKLAALAEEARHWRFEQEKIPLFWAEEGISFSRPDPRCDTRTLSETYRLPRLHSRELSALLRRSAGQLHAEGVRFTWSAGVLLAERGRSFEPMLSGKRGQGVRLESSLGRWEILEDGTRLLAPTERKGDRVKKEFQELRVPVFFRGCVPLLKKDGRPLALLPARLDKRLSSEKIKFAPSPLASWWLTRAD